MRGVNSKERILKASIEEFSKLGFHGARVESIAEKADINKAMIFYYFSSKEELYKRVLAYIVGKVVSSLTNSGVVRDDITPEEYLDEFPEIYIKLFYDNPEFLRIIGLGMIQNGDYIKSVMKNVISEIGNGIPEKFSSFVRKWNEDGMINESDPAHFFLNIVSLTLFPLISKPFAEAIFGKEFNEKNFLAERLRSIKNILEKGMIR